MSKRPKFQPNVTRVKLNPEQSVLACDCYDTGKRYSFDRDWEAGPACFAMDEYDFNTKIWASYVRTDIWWNSTGSS